MTGFERGAFVCFAFGCVWLVWLTKRVFGVFRGKSTTPPKPNEGVEGAPAANEWDLKSEDLVARDRFWEGWY